MSTGCRPPRWWPYRDEFPEWRLWRGDNQRFYARLPGTSPLVVVSGKDVADLRDQVTKETSRRNGGPKATGADDG
jgi:hypothetical protein